ncbi:MAG: 3-hydroxyacyl-CoA dehydrogenase [Pigmentiphaga sp.]|nr:3-hydroxyacyl-CoA dehydrogenase [Pigmentiphaga sp.]
MPCSSHPASISETAEAYLADARAQVMHGTEWPIASPSASDHYLAVVGAGTMGRGIAQAGLAAGCHVTVVDRQPMALERCRREIQASLDKARARGWLSSSASSSRLGRLSLATNLALLTQADVVIEAVDEDLDLKCRLLAQLDRQLPPHALLVSNTSTLDIDAMGSATRRPGQVLGMHFLTPAHITPLVEVIQGAATSAGALARGRQLALRMDKLPVLVRNAWGFIGNRLYEGFLREVDALQLEGVPAHRIDSVLEGFGFALGPCRTLDMSGTDLVSQVIAARGRHVEQAPAYRRITQRLNELGRHGYKTNLGHYRYIDRLPQVDPELAEICAAEARRLGILQRPGISDAALLERCLIPLFEEGRQVLAEGVARRESDIDLVWVLGYGFPASRGGPMFYGRHAAGRIQPAAE